MSDTTNLYIGNLPASIQEEFLVDAFLKFGPIASVKIMKPRFSDELHRRKLTGFVCFMERWSADWAMHEMQDSMLMGNEIHLDWGKPLDLPQFPKFPSSVSQDSCPYNNGNRRQIPYPSDSELQLLIDKTAQFAVQFGDRFLVFCTCFFLAISE